MLGPRRSSRNEIRFDAMPSELPGPSCASICAGSCAARRAKSAFITPTNTPVGEPASRATGWPASSSASQATSSSRRCCGSIRAASRGEIRKKPGSNRSMCSRKPPRLHAGARAESHAGGTSSGRPIGRLADRFDAVDEQVPVRCGTRLPSEIGTPSRRSRSARSSCVHREPAKVTREHRADRRVIPTAASDRVRARARSRARRRDAPPRST